MIEMHPENPLDILLRLQDPIPYGSAIWKEPFNVPGYGVITILVGTDKLPAEQGTGRTLFYFPAFSVQKVTMDGSTLSFKEGVVAVNPPLQQPLAATSRMRVYFTDILGKADPNFRIEVIRAIKSSPTLGAAFGNASLENTPIVPVAMEDESWTIGVKFGGAQGPFNTLGLFDRATSSPTGTYAIDLEISAAERTKMLNGNPSSISFVFDKPYRARFLRSATQVILSGWSKASQEFKRKADSVVGQPLSAVIAVGSGDIVASEGLKSIVTTNLSISIVRENGQSTSEGFVTDAVNKLWSQATKKIQDMQLAMDKWVSVVSENGLSVSATVGTINELGNEIENELKNHNEELHKLATTENDQGSLNIEAGGKFLKIEANAKFGKTWNRSNTMNREDFHKNVYESLNKVKQSFKGTVNGVTGISFDSNGQFVSDEVVRTAINDLTYETGMQSFRYLIRAADTGEIASTPREDRIIWRPYSGDRSYTFSVTAGIAQIPPQAPFPGGGFPGGGFPGGGFPGSGNQPPATEEMVVSGPLVISTSSTNPSEAKYKIAFTPKLTVPPLLRAGETELRRFEKTHSTTVTAIDGAVQRKKSTDEIERAFFDLVENLVGVSHVNHQGILSSNLRFRDSLFVSAAGSGGKEPIIEFNYITRASLNEFAKDCYYFDFTVLGRVGSEVLRPFGLGHLWINAADGNLERIDFTIDIANQVGFMFGFSPGNNFTIRQTKIVCERKY